MPLLGALHPRGDGLEFRHSLLRGAADISAAAAVGGPTPLSLARAAGGGAVGSVTHLVLEAARPWSRHTHQLFSAAARARAVELMLIGELLSRDERFLPYGPQAVLDAWEEFVVKHAVSR